MAHRTPTALQHSYQNVLADISKYNYTILHELIGTFVCVFTIMPRYLKTMQ